MANEMIPKRTALTATCQVTLKVSVEIPVTVETRRLPTLDENADEFLAHNGISMNDLPDWFTENTWRVLRKRILEQIPDDIDDRKIVDCVDVDFE